MGMNQYSHCLQSPDNNYIQFLVAKSVRLASKFISHQITGIVCKKKQTLRKKMKIGETGEMYTS